jgi:hypothetical protein
MKKNKIIKTIASISAMGAVAGGTAIGMASCGENSDVPTPSIHFATFSDLKIGDLIYDVQFPEQSA